MSFEAAIHEKTITLNRLCLDMCATAGSGHPTSALSLGHITTVLMYHSMRWLPDHPKYPTSDRLVLSEGHAVPIIYAAMADIGGAVGSGDQSRPLSVDDLQTFRQSESVLDGHPNPMEGFPFFDAATGSLGQGLSAAAGMAIAARADEFDKRIFCIIGDGESREGQIAEALDFIIDYKLANVLPIFNCNGYGQADKVAMGQSPETLMKKLDAYGFHVTLIDGHEPEQIKKAFDEFASRSAGDEPMVVVAKTIKGWGVPSMQGGGWHGKPATSDKLAQAQEELQATGAGLTSALAGFDLTIYPPAEDTTPEQQAATDPPTFHEAMSRYDMGQLLSTRKLATRKAYGLALRVIGHCNQDVFALDGDVRNSTFAEWFANDAELADRFVGCKIAEQNMFSVAVGLSAAGKVPFCSTFSKFVTRGYDQIEMAINSGANLKIIGSHSGISLAADGPSQMSLPDVAWFRSFATTRDHYGNPACYVIQPADAYAAYGLTLAMADYHGVCYMRTHRPDVEFIYDENTKFNLGGMELLTPGRDLLIVTAGYMVHECNKALETLDKMAIDVSLVDLYSIPFNADRLLDFANDAAGNVLVVEDNYGASLGSAVADACAESGDGFTIEQLHVKRIPKSAESEDAILKQCGLHYTDITEKAAAMLGVPVGAT